MLVTDVVGRYRWIARFAPLVRQRMRFFVAELTGRKLLRTYTPRGSRYAVEIRHASGDLFILEELFGTRVYEPPPQVVRILDDIAAPRILDLGGHVGLFGAFALERWPAATLVSYEPDPGNLVLLDRTRRRNGLQARWGLEAACAGSSAGAVVFAAIGDSVSHVAGEGEQGVVVRRHDVVPEVLAADVVKIDIEGAEWAILEDSRLAQGGPCAIVLEYHAQAGAMDVQSARARATRRLESMGYAVDDIGLPSPRAGMLWAWRSL